VAIVRSTDTPYVGGMVLSINERTDRESYTVDEKVFTFKYQHGRLTILYDWRKINGF
jgi:hypothetical protein